MFQTQLLKSEPPFQIITAAGQVGIQVATLIVSEEKATDDGKFVIETHSHPVVNYGLKEGLAEMKKYGASSPEEDDIISTRLQPEGAVWSSVDIKDVKIIGLAGSENYISTDRFLWLVKMSKFDVGSQSVNLWDDESVDNIFWFNYSLSKVGVKVKSYEEKNLSWEKYKYVIYLKLDWTPHYPPLVHVTFIKDEGFYCLLAKSNEEEVNIDSCLHLIKRAIYGLNGIILPYLNVIFKHIEVPAYKGNPLEDKVERLTHYLNEEFTKMYQYTIPDTDHLNIPSLNEIQD